MRTLTFLFLLLLSVPVWAQDAAATEAAKGFWADPINDPMMPLYALTGLIFIVLILVLFVAAYMVRILHMLANQAAKEKAEKLGVVYKEQPSLWSRIWRSLNATVPLEEEKNIELDHNYDGIRELDNHLPPWWKWLFYGTIVWGIIYFIAYHVTDSAPLQIQEYENEVAAAESQKQKFLAGQPKVEIDENTLTYTKDDAIITKGKDIFLSNCAPCHKNLGEGGIGPNLTDDYWIHGGDVKNVYSVVKNGVPEKGMISWASVLSPEQIRDVSFFVMSIHGTNPPGAKAPQGELYKPQQQTAPADSTQQVQASL